MRLVYALALAILLPAVASAAAPRGARTARDEDRRFGIAEAIAISQVQSPAWSRDGSRIAFVVNAPDTSESTNNQDLWLHTLATGETRRLTRHAKNDYAPSFSPGGDTLAFLSARADDGRPAIWFLPLRGGEPFTFGTFAESVGEIEWSPDGTSIAFTMLDSLPKAVKEWRKKKWDPIVEDERLQYNHLWVVDVATGRQTRLTSGAYNVAQPRWSPDSRSIAYLSNPTGKVDDGNLTDIAVVPAKGGAPRMLGAIGPDGFAWSPDSRWIAWAAGENRDAHVEKALLWVSPASGGKPVALTRAFDEDAQTPVWSSASDTLFFHSQQGVTTRAAAVARTGGAVVLTDDRRGEAGDLVSGPNGRVAFGMSQPTWPGEIWIADHPTAAARRATNVNESVSTLTFGETRVVKWASDDGVRVEGVLVRPAGADRHAALKTVVLTHGGPYGARDGLGFKTWARVLASAGYQVFMPNFRASGGYGTAFMMRRRADWGGQDWRDVSTGIDSLVRWGLADGQRLAKMGHSYGGYLSAWAITQTTRFDAAVVSAGAVDLASLWGQSDTHRYRAFEFEGEPWKTPDLWRRSSPLTYVANVKTPTLIQIGRDDQRIPYPQGQELYQSLTFLGVPTQFVAYPREPHGLRESRHRADWWSRQIAWFDRWVK